jgi:cytochrome c55X
MNRNCPSAIRRAQPKARLRPLLALIALLLAAPASAEPSVPDAARSQVLVRMVRQDCGSCHGMRLTGGLGPALTPEALAERPLEMLTTVIYRGRPGTPMPGWQSMLNESEAQWIAQKLLAGFPAEVKAAR